MKRTVSIIISMMCVASSLFFTSCQSDPIVGTWQSVIYSMKIDGHEDDGVFANGHYVEFDEDGSFTDYPATGETYYSTWTLSGNNVYSIEPYEDALLKQFYIDFGSDAHLLSMNPVLVYLGNDSIIISQTYDFEYYETIIPVEVKTLYERSR